MCELEDPSHSWIQLVLAIQSGNESELHDILEYAKQSNWTLELWNELENIPDDELTDSEEENLKDEASDTEEYEDIDDA